MRVFIDGDACSSKKIRQKFKNTEIVTVVSVENCADIHHTQNTIVVDSTPQAADIEIFNRLKQGDIVITRDYGLASLVLGKNGKAMSPTGFIYTKHNIEMLLHQRHLNRAMRSTNFRRKKKQAKYNQNARDKA